ncbi:MAG: NAD(P)H-hydrate dehydratase [Oscillospiraceae bacterium]|nr:NAD(P)H-hydrate dehydratase [Oscillospiraceae bacterium]
MYENDYLVTPEQMRTLEQLTDQAGISYAQMMENAGKALAEILLEEYPDKDNFLFLAGTGNNGGDCLVAAFYLKQAGKQVEIAMPLGEPKTEISQNAYQRVLKSQIPVLMEDQVYTIENESNFKTAEIIIDGLFGIGFHGELPKKIGNILDRLFFEKIPIVACDIPSGGDGLTGQVSTGTCLADLTVTFGAEKIGMSQYPLREYCGKIRVADIEIPKSAFHRINFAKCLTMKYVRNTLPKRKPADYKNKFGHALVIAGSSRMRGACVLASMACMRSGVGLLTCASAEQALSALSVRMPECMCLPLETDSDGFFLNSKGNQDLLKSAMQNKSAILIGCGMGVTEQTRELLKFLLAESESNKCPVILDADGLNAIASCIEYIPEGRTILTPHSGEAAKLLGISTEEVQKDRIASAKKLAEITGAIVILKGAGTIITDGEQMFVCNAGNPGMARAGSGDVLAGIVTALVAQSMQSFFDINIRSNPEPAGMIDHEIAKYYEKQIYHRNLINAAYAGVKLHAVAGDRTAEKMPMPYMLPQDMIDSLQDIL